MSLPQFPRRGLLRMWPADHAEPAARGLIETLWRCRLNYLDAVPQLRERGMQARPDPFKHCLIVFGVRTVIFMERKPVFRVRERGHDHGKLVLRRARIMRRRCIEHELGG